MRRNFKAFPLHEVDPDLFWSCVEIAGDRDCWPWLCATTDAGYGTLYVLGKTVLAHRVSWALQRHQSPKKGIVIRHGCDNPPCVNPSHLYSGTQADNNRDVLERARRKGYNSVAVARALADGADRDDLVKIFGMHPETATEYVRLGPEGSVERAAKRGVPRLRRATIDRRTIVRAPEAVQAARGGATVADLMRDFGVSRATAYRYLERSKS